MCVSLVLLCNRHFFNRVPWPHLGFPVYTLALHVGFPVYALALQVGFPWYALALHVTLIKAQR